MALVRLWSQLTTRKLWRWTAGYLASAWVVLQALDLLGNHFSWPPLVFRAAVVTLAGGFARTLVLAWYHGERGRQRLSGVELLLLATLILATLAIIGLTLPKATPASAAEVPGAGGASEAVAAPPGRAAERASVAVLPFANVAAIPPRSTSATA